MTRARLNGKATELEIEHLDNYLGVEALRQDRDGLAVSWCPSLGSGGRPA